MRTVIWINIDFFLLSLLNNKIWGHWMKNLFFLLLLCLIGNFCTVACAQDSKPEPENEILYSKAEKTIKELMPEGMEFIGMTIKNDEIYLEVKIFKYTPLDNFIINCGNHPGLARPVVVKGNEFKWPKIVTIKIAIEPSWIKNEHKKNVEIEEKQVHALVSDPIYTTQLDSVKQDITSLSNAIKSYKFDNNMYPSTEQGLRALVEAPKIGVIPPNWRRNGYFYREKIPKDPWGNNYIYLSPSKHDEFEIRSYGADGVPGGKRINKDIIMRASDL